MSRLERCIVAGELVGYRFDCPDNPASRCHSFITDGRISFCGDSEHALAGQTVDLPEVAP